MKLDFEQIKNITVGAIDVKNTDSGVEFYRLTKAQVDGFVKEQADHQIPQRPGGCGVVQHDRLFHQKAVEEDPVDGLEEEVKVGQVEDDGPPLVHGEPAGDEKEDRHMEGVDEPIKALVPTAPLGGEGEQMAQHRQKNEDTFQIVKAVSPLFHGKWNGKDLPSMGCFPNIAHPAWDFKGASPT